MLATICRAQFGAMKYRIVVDDSITSGVHVDGFAKIIACAPSATVSQLLQAGELCRDHDVECPLPGLPGIDLLRGHHQKVFETH